ncbi:hypothetical protein Lal_00014648 [Lupinus albus]|nr:hypothetical protein Lal_00014648 [Lupinus albus]
MAQIISMLQLRGAFWISTSELCFGFDQLEAMEQRLNNRMDLHFQGLKDSYFAGMEQYEERQTAYSDNQFRELRNLINLPLKLRMPCLFRIQKLSVLIRGDQNIVTSADHTDDPHPHLNLSLEDLRPRISYLRLIVITASDICASYQPCQHNLQAITFDVEFVIIKKGEIESVHV